ncbi:hypothetical protein L211DRAFT_849159 [Terfezia boudieri ATCC MYA-4762]|uniref:Uncharacterized protein n=1 Tax=Terfezia boudieri ATCC MYA-4762 TaxID=1051890 RepID=A0A3N4LQP6_9PEZI|nr:hypothetical protein L211DRAFT_849159 [Terfezia boudieri ATCC MYA-4762]
MPPHLHPRSLSTTSLFSTTLALAFMVVAVPHILPCPVRGPPWGYRVDATGSQEEEGDKFYKDDGETAKEERRRRRRREERKCPIPRGGGGLVEELRKWMGGTSEGEGVREVVFEKRLGGSR